MQKKSYYKVLVFFFIIFFQQNSFGSIIEGIPRIIDGDSLEIKNNRIRLFGINAPEKKQICQKPYFNIFFFHFQKKYECGLFVKNQLKKFINGKKIKCISNGKDRYNRHLSICYLKNKDINSWLVKNGYAIAYKKYSKKYILEEKYAKENKLGIWLGAFQKPEIWRKKH